ncbi:MAG TPA: GMC family oxidoreductase N-terminal domain-containing protein [Solirubrobacteraceae bacterium]|nr:GMC family oxidoreductase N-terminal domain-containing protein [Solirubrobacteraceae bacterium]
MAAGRLDADVIVVGAGSAGAAVARRLVDRGDLSVLLLEAGDDDTNPAIRDPGRSHELWHAAEDWDYLTVPQPHAAGRRLHWPRGRVVGGSSALNGMVWARGAPADYDGWRAGGCAGWGWEDVLPLFIEIEDYDGGASPVHGTGGPVHVSTLHEPAPVHRAIIDAAVEAGIPFNPDYNSGTLDGVSVTQLSVKDGERHGSSAAYLREVRESQRLRLLTGAQAERVLLSGGHASGVEWVRDGQRESARADVEVILCAGAIGSPELLLRSGVGPAPEIGRHGIELAQELPGVGQNLHDHLLAPLVFSAEREIEATPPGLPQLQSHLFWRSRPDLPAPDMQPAHFDVPLYEEWMEGPANGFTLLAGMVRPASRGTLRLSGPHAGDRPLLDPQTLSEPSDHAVLVAAIELCREVGRAPALAAGWGARELYPGPEADLGDYARRAAITYHHQVGTCRMGEDAGAVVDSRLRVRGIERLRVADASVMPSVTCANTNAPTIMIAERAARFFAEDHA